MKSTATCLLLLTCLTVLSCEDEAVLTEKDYLTTGSWVLKHKQRTLTVNKIVTNVDSEAVTQELYKEILTFEPAGRVKYVNGQLVAPILGRWTLNEEEKRLITDLSLEPPASTGFSTQRFYPSSQVLELTKDKLVLQQTSKGYYISWPKGGQQIDTTETIMVSFFEH